MEHILDCDEHLANYQGPPLRVTFSTDTLATFPLWNSSDTMLQYTYKFMSDRAMHLCKIIIEVEVGESTYGQIQGTGSGRGAIPSRSRSIALHSIHWCAISGVG